MTTVMLVEPDSDSAILREVFASLKRQGIDARPFFSPLTSTPPFERCHTLRMESRWSYRIPPVSLNLPSAHDITRDDVRCVVSAIRDGMK